MTTDGVIFTRSSPVPDIKVGVLAACLLLAHLASAAAQDAGTGLKAVLARGVAHSGTPVSAADRFLADEGNPTLVVQNGADRESLLQYSVIADDVRGLQPNTVIDRAPLYVGQKTWASVRIAASTPELRPGRYRIEVVAEAKRAAVLPFEVASPPASADSRPPAGLEDARNIALAALGGKVRVRLANGRSSDATELNDGFAFTVSRFGYSCESCGWSAADTDLPIEIAATFYRNREADVRAVAIDTATWKSRTGPTGTPRYVEVFAARPGQGGAFDKVAEAVLQPRAGEQWIALSGVRTSEIRLVVRSDNGGDTVQIGELKVIEDPKTADTVLRDLPIDLGRAALGATVVSATSQADDRQSVYRLIDGDPGSRWVAQDARLPQDIVLALPGDRLARIDRVAIDLPEARGGLARPTRVAVAVSTQDPRTGFTEVADARIPIDGPSFEIPVGREARYVRFRVLEAFGDRPVAITSLRLMEAARQAGYVPALERPPERAAGNPGLWSSAANEREPNDVNAQPIGPGQAIKGTLSSRDDKDVFALPRYTGPAALNLTFDGRPYVRFGLDLLDDAKNRVKHLSPAELSSLGPDVTWRLQGRERYLQFTQPPTGVVLLWDGSDGVAGWQAQIAQAMQAYVRENAGDQAIALMRYSDVPEVVSQDFTSDPQALVAAMQDKFSAGGGRSLFTALGQAADLLDRVDGNRVIIAISSGSDTRSVTPSEQVWAKLARKGIRLYALAVGSEIQQYFPSVGSTPVGILEHGVASTGGGTFRVDDPKLLADAARKIGEDLRRPPQYAFKASLTSDTARVEVKPADSGGPPPAARAEIVVDASSGMTQPVPGNASSRLDSVKIALRRVFRTLPERPAIAFRAFGHRLRTVGKCLDTELLVPLEISSPQSLLRELDRLEARGASLPARSFEQASRDIRGGRKQVIAITGTPEECDDLGATVAKVVDQDPQVRLDIIGVGVPAGPPEAAYRAAAARAGGLYLAASDDRQVEAALRQLLQPRYLVSDASGDVAASAPLGGTVSVPAGIYTLRVDSATQFLALDRVRLAAGEATTVTAAGDRLSTGAATQEVKVRPAAGAEPEGPPEAPRSLAGTGGTAAAWKTFDVSASDLTASVERSQQGSTNQAALTADQPVVPPPPPPPPAAMPKAAAQTPSPPPAAAPAPPPPTPAPPAPPAAKPAAKPAAPAPAAEPPREADQNAVPPPPPPPPALQAAQAPAPPPGKSPEPRPGPVVPPPSPQPATAPAEQVAAVPAPPAAAPRPEPAPPPEAARPAAPVMVDLPPRNDRPVAPDKAPEPQVPPAAAVQAPAAPPPAAISAAPSAVPQLRRPEAVAPPARAAQAGPPPFTPDVAMLTPPIAAAPAPERAAPPAAGEPPPPPKQKAPLPASETRTPEPPTLVRDLQRKLKDLGYTSVHIDGVMGPRTRQAVARMQAEAGLPPETGITTVIAQADFLREARLMAQEQDATSSVGEQMAAALTPAPPSAAPPAPAPPASSPDLSPPPAAPAAAAPATSPPSPAVVSPPAAFPPVPSPAAPAPAPPPTEIARAEPAEPRPAAPPAGFLGTTLQAQIGPALDDASARKLELTYLFALDVLAPGRSMSWEGSSRNISGQVLVGTWVEDPRGTHRTCRSFRQEIQVNGSTYRDPTTSVACRQNGSKWTLVESKPPGGLTSTQ